MKYFKVLGISMLICTMAYSQGDNTLEGRTEWDNGNIYFVSEDGQFKTRFDVRLFMQAGKFYDDPEGVMSNSTIVRKARFAMKVDLWKFWKAEWDMDISDVSIEMKDMWLAYTGLNNAFIKLGNYKVPFGLEILTSSRYISFAERSYPSMAFKMGRRMSIGYTKWGERWNLGLSYFGQEAIPGDRKGKADETGGGYGMRFATAPQFGSLLFHLGGSYVNFTPDNELEMAEFKSEPENKLGDSEHVDTGSIINVDHTIQQGIESAIQWNNFCVQGEYMMADVYRFGELNGINYEDAHFEGGYAFISWILTGEKRPWDNTQGEFGQIIPSNNKLGAIELLFRYSYINLSDPLAISAGSPDGILGGKAVNTTLGVNWYVNPNMKFTANYIMTDNSINADDEVSGGDYDFNSILIEAKIFF
jgi:phosphate-selective porin OprO and OprP